MYLTSKILFFFWFVLFYTRNLGIIQVFTIVPSFYYSWHAKSPFASCGFYQ